jgi:type IV pilus assembly protein PilQ
MLNRLRIDSDMDNRMLPGISRRLGTLTAIVACLAGTTVGWAQDAGLSDLMEEMFDEFADVPDQNADGEPTADKASDEPVDLSYLEDKVRVNEYDIVDLHVNNEDLGNVLQLLSLQSQRNIVASNNVTATVTADLYNVTFEEAMDAILHVNGFGYINKGNFIYVYTAEELTEIEQASRILVSRTITLDYLNAADAATFVQPLLSADGKITATNQAGPYAIGAGTPVGGEDYASNAMLVVFDYDENIDQIIALIDQLDIKPVQVLVEATILQTSLNEANAFGVDFSILNNMDFVDFVGSGPLGVVDDLISGIGATMAGGSTTATTVPIRGNGAAINTSVGKTSDAAGIKAGIINEDVAVFLRLLDEVTDVTVISNPKLLTLNRQPARVLVGTKVGYLQTTSTQTSSTQSVQFLDTGTQLNVRPFVSADGMIRMELMPQVSSFRLRNITDATGATVTIPDEDTSELVTNVMVRDGQTVVLGGLFTETTSASRRQVPGIGDIPLIGAAFRGHDDTTRRSEIIFMITPSIVNDIMLTEGGNRANEYMDYTRAGARQGLLPWSRERRISRLLQEAEDAVRAGDRELAISKTRWALDLHPQNASARRVLDQLSETEASISGSMLDDILQHELDLPQPSSSVPSLDAEFMSHSMSMSIDQEIDNAEVTDWLLSEGTAEPYSSQNQPLDNSASSSEDIAINPYSQPADTAVSDSFASFEGSQGFYQLTEQELVLRQSSPVVFAPEAVWLPDQAMWKPQPGDFVADENGALVEFNPYETPSEQIAPVEATPIEEEVANVDDDSLSMNDSDEPQDFSTGWGEDEFTAAFGADAEQQPWFFPIHGGLVWIPIPRGFFPADQADSLFGGADEVISTVPTEDGGLAD